MKDYDFVLQYHPRKTNIVADALSQRPHRTIASLMIRQLQALETMAEFGVQPVLIEGGGVLGCMVVQDTLVDRIFEAQQKDVELRGKFAKMIAKDPGDWSIGSDGGFRFKNWLIVPKSSDIKKDILEEAHRSGLTVYLGGMKLYRDLKRTFWWEGMKREVAKFVSECLTCQHIKAEHRKPSGLLQLLPILQ